MYTETPMTFLGGNYVPSDTLKRTLCLLIDFHPALEFNTSHTRSFVIFARLLVQSTPCWTMIKYQKSYLIFLIYSEGWLMAAVLFQVAFACSCHILYDDEDHGTTTQNRLLKKSKRACRTRPLSRHTIEKQHFYIKKMR